MKWTKSNAVILLLCTGLVMVFDVLLLQTAICNTGFGKALAYFSLGFCFAIALISIMYVIPNSPSEK